MDNKKVYSDVAHDKRRKNYKSEETDEDGGTTDDDLDENDIKPPNMSYNRRESIPVAPITINVTAYADDANELPKATRNNTYERNISIKVPNVTSERNENGNEDENNEVTTHKIRMQIDKRLLELLKLPIKEFVMLPVSII